MRPKFLKIRGSLILGALFFLTACEKTEVKPPPVPPPGLSTSVQWTIQNLAGIPQGPVTDLYALVSVVNAQNQPVLTNTKLRISFDGLLRTEEIQLPAGSHRVTGFIITNAAGTAVYATPKANSGKAGLVNRPLAIPFVLPQPVVHLIAMEVLPILPGDTPQHFGYSAGAFDPTGPNPPGDGSNFLKVSLRASIKVGEILYDSIPATILYTYWDENQQAFGKYITLAAGSNEVQLPRSATRHHFRMTKWGVSYEMNLLKTEVQEGTLYTLGGEKAAKMLKSELTYKLVDGVYKPEKKTVFNYRGPGQLSEIQYYLRRADNTTYLAQRDEFRYNAGNKLEKINQYDESNNYMGFRSFSYNAAGKVNLITEEGIAGLISTATVDYHFSPATEWTEVSFNYTYAGSSIGMRYYQRYFRGNRISDNSATSNHSTETGQYQYDSYINPFAHMGWLNLFLSNESRNNIVAQQKTFYGNMQLAVPYSFAYTYDAEGYPVELITQYKSGVTGEYLFTTKTVYQY